MFLLSNEATQNLRVIDVNMVLLDPSTDKEDLSPWAKGVVAYAIKIGIFMP